MDKEEDQSDKKYLAWERTRDWTWRSSAFSPNSSWDSSPDEVINDDIKVIDITSNRGSDEYDNAWEENNALGPNSQEREIKKTSSNFWDRVSGTEAELTKENKSETIDLTISDDEMEGRERKSILGGDVLDNTIKGKENKLKTHGTTLQSVEDTFVGVDSTLQINTVNEMGKMKMNVMNKAAIANNVYKGDVNESFKRTMVKLNNNPVQKDKERKDYKEMTKYKNIAQKSRNEKKEDKKDKTNYNKVKTVVDMKIRNKNYESQNMQRIRKCGTLDDKMSIRNMEVTGGFIDITSGKIDIPQEVKTVLSWGPKFTVPFDKYNLEDIIDMVDDVEREWEITSMDERKRNIEKWKSNTIKKLVNERCRLDSNQRLIVKMTTALDDFISQNKNLIIIQADKGNSTILMEKQELNKMIEIFIQKQVMNGLYEKITETGDEIKVKLNKEMAMLRLKVSNNGEWKTKGIFMDRCNKNVAIEEEFWKGIRAVENKIPEMIFTIKAHKKPMALRNICPKNKAITYGVSKVVAAILEMAI